MTVYFSDNISLDGVNRTAIPAPSLLKNADIVHTRLRVKRMFVNFAGSVVPVATDVVRFGTFKLTDRIYEVWNNINVVMGSAGTMDIGFHETGARHNGIVADADLFATAVSLNATGRADVFNEATAAFTHLHRGKTIRQLLDIGRGDTVYTTTKGDIQVDLTGTLGGTLAALGQVTIDVWYVSGD